MKKHLLILGLIICSLSGFSQVLSGFFPNGMPGYKYTMQSQYYSHPLYAVNDSTAGFDSAGYYIQSLGRNATNDSIVLTLLNGRRLAALAGATSGGGGGSAAGSTYQVQYNNAGAFAASPGLSYNPSAIAVNGIARGLYVNGTLSASANLDTLALVDIANPATIANPTGTIYTIRPASLRVGGPVDIWGTYSPNNFSNAFSLHRKLTGAGIQGMSLYDTLIANANSTTTTAVKINPVFNNGAFTGVTNWSLDVNGLSKFYSVTANTVITDAYLQAGTTTKVIMSEYGVPDVTFYTSNGTGMIGIEAGAAIRMPTSLKNDMFIRTTNDLLIGDGTIGPKVKVFGSTGAMMIQYGGTLTSIPTSMFTVNSTTAGSIPYPRMTTAQRTAIVSPADGLMVYDTDFHKLYLNENGTWVQK